MAITYNYTNNSQSSYVPVNVNPTPVADPEDLIWTVGPTAPAYSGGNGSIFATIVQDNVIPAVWYHGGNPIIDVNTLSFFGTGLINATYTTLSTISGQRNKGLNEIRLGNTLALANVTTTTGTIFETVLAAHNLLPGMLVYISSIVNIPDATGYWVVDTTPSASEFTLLGYTLGGNAVAQGNVQQATYYWDEVYTTPLGSYDAVTDGSPIGQFEFSITNDDSNELKMYVEDPNIVPQTGDSLVIQKRLGQTPNSSITTDGINSMVNNFNVETYTFKVQAVTFAQFPQPNAFSIDYTEYTLTLDKSFAPQTTAGTANDYNLVLLNRTGVGANKSLLTDTWQPKEVHREQVIGDPYNYVGVLQPKGQKNYLYYEGSKFLGVSTMLDGIINSTKTPYIVLDFENEIKDRLSYVVGDVEIHLPNIMIQDEVVPSILSNTNASGNLLTYFTETNGVNKYAPLYLKNGANPTKRYGYVFFDLRIIIIDDAELATAVGHASKRNYTLPKLLLTSSANTLANSGPSNPLTIVGASNTTPVLVTVSSNHNLQDGDFVTVVDVQGNTQTNSPANVYYYAKKITNSSFELYQNLALTIPVVGNGNYIPGTGTCYSAKLAYEYFLTYRLKGPHYKTLPYAEVIPFNFETAGVIQNTSGQIQLELPFLSHLVDNTTTIGFESSEWEVIMGKYVPSIDNPYVVNGTTDVTYLESQALTLFSGLNQATTHSMTITKAQYNTDLPLFPYDILTGDPIFNTLSPLPDTMYISEMEWFTGNIMYREHAEQYRMTFTFNIPANKWNGTTNPSYVAGDSFMSSKLITELGFFINDDNSRDNKPYIYGKISPPIKKDNASALSVEISIDF